MTVRAKSGDPFIMPISKHIWNTKYRYHQDGMPRDETIFDTWKRVARAIATPEKEQAETWTYRFLDILNDFKFLPGGRILAGAGTGRQVTLFNCFVMGIIEDSMESIFENLKEGAITMQQGGGVGYDFSTLRPAGTHARGTGTIASGPVSFMHIWDAMCATILSTGARRGAMMATLRCDHPDIEAFVTAKNEPGKLRHFNLSVLITDDFMNALEKNADWELVFPIRSVEADEASIVYRSWSGQKEPVPCRIFRRVPARRLWDLIMRSTYDHAEPGVLFIDRINRMNNLGYHEVISATNPCGEVPLPPYGACNLGSINLCHFIIEPFHRNARVDFDAIADVTRVAVRFLDNVIDVSRFPLPQQEQTEKNCRRIGLGITGLADALIMLGLRYDSEKAREVAFKIMETLCFTAYRTSIELAREKGPFPLFQRDAYLESPFIRSLPDDIRDGIARHGIRNSHLLAIAPTGTISLLANNVSSGIEPVFDYTYRRRVFDMDGSMKTYELEDYAWYLWRREHRSGTPLPPAFIDAREIHPRDHLAMQAALQPRVDNSISKTINIPIDFPFDEFKDIYRMAYQLGLKGCTTFRPNPITGVILFDGDQAMHAPHCCSLEREAD